LNYPATYPNYYFENWTLSVEPGKRVELTFTDVSIECNCSPCVDSQCAASCDNFACSYCPFDYVQVLG
jgi:hypothetical protein